MLDWIQNADRAVFLFINGALANPITDAMMPVVTNDNLLRLAYGLVVIAILTFGRKRFFWVAVFSAIVVVLTDQSASALLKPAIGRLRPCKVMDVHLLVGCGSGFSFPSSHAANLFGQAVFFGLLFKKYLPYTLGFAFLIGVSRIFVGVHYPVDVLGGLILGSLEGWLAAWILWRLNDCNLLKPSPVLTVSLFSRKNTGRGNSPNSRPD
jgi:undecaprenyl-diphosphatase